MDDTFCIYVYRYQHDSQYFPVTNSDRQISFVVNDGAFNSTTVTACVQLLNINDAPSLTLGPNGTVDVVVMYTEGQTDPLFLVPQLEIEGKINTLCAKCWYLWMNYGHVCIDITSFVSLSCRY